MTSRSIAGKVALADPRAVSVAYLRHAQGIGDALDLAIIEAHEGQLIRNLAPPKGQATTAESAAVGTPATCGTGCASQPDCGNLAARPFEGHQE